MGVFPPFKETPTWHYGSWAIDPFRVGFFIFPICEKLRLHPLGATQKGESHLSAETVFWKTHNTRVGFVRNLLNVRTSC